MQMITMYLKDGGSSSRGVGQHGQAAPLSATGTAEINGKVRSTSSSGVEREKRHISNHHYFFIGNNGSNFPMTHENNIYVL
jgi:hypothetical protein